ncbi:unnamed protein product [Prunus armeniaca]
MKWMSYLQQFNIIIKYKKWVTNKLADMLSRPPGHSALLVAMQLQPVILFEYVTSYDNDPEFKLFFDKLQHGKPCQFEMKDGLIFKGKQLCIPNNGNRLRWIREVHTSRCAGHFGVDKTLLNLQRYVYWPQMHVDVSHFIRGCVLCNTHRGSWGCIHHFRYQIGLGKVSQWISWVVCLQPQLPLGLITCLLWWTDLAKW